MIGLLSFSKIIISRFSTNGVPAGYRYNVETIREAIKKAYGANVKLDCRGGALNEVSLNFYVRGKDQYEITNVLQPGNCRGAVYFPRK